MPWYGSGTIAVTANGNNAAGTGTQFLGNVRIGDGLAIQGSATLHEVTGVTSNTQLTFAPPFTGTAGSGKAFRVVPVLGYDKDLSDAFNALRLQFGNQLANLQPWATAATQSEALDALGLSATGKAVATGTPAQGRSALVLGSAATASLTASITDDTVGRVVKIGDCGIGVGVAPTPSDCNDVYQHGFWYANDTCLNKPLTTGGMLYVSGAAGRTALKSQIFVSRLNAGVFTRVLTSSGAWTSWVTLLSSINTTIDANGFIKSASPIVKLYTDRIELNSDEAATFQRVEAGYYQISNCNGLRLDDGWYIETPHDKNGNKYFNVEWDQDVEPETDAGVLEEPADVTLTIRCYERAWNPQTGTYDNGAPVDIPEGRWIDLRLNEVRQPEPEMPDEPDAPQQPTEPGAPVVPHIVTKAQGKAALIQTGLWQSVVDYIASIEDETERLLAEIALNDAHDYRRDSPFLNAAADALGITEEQKDELFILAANILL